MDEDTAKCMFGSWYLNFKDVTFKSEIITLPNSFVDYLNADGLYMPASAFPKFASDPYDRLSDDEWSDEEDADNVENTPSFPDLERDIAQTIEKLGGAIFPKLNWSSPKDATWMSVGGNLKCTTPHDIFLLLKSSDFVNYDLEQLALPQPDSPSSTTSAPPTTPVPCTLVLRKWYNLQQSMEFRCFVHRNTLIGISQRDYTNYYEFLKEGNMMQQIQQNITEFFTTYVQHHFPSENYTFDVYVSSTQKVWLLDFNPWNPNTEALMFDWEELTQPAWEGLSFRIVESQAAIRPTLAMTNRLPADLVDVSNGSAIDELCRNLRTQELAGK
jgi:hypothetical protein